MKCFEGIDNIIFDFDGTLCESEEDIKSSWRSAIRELKLDTARFERVYRTGPPTEESARSFFPDADDALIRRLCEVYWGIYRASDYPYSHPYPGVEAMLAHLRRAGKRLFLATNKTGIPLGRLLAKFGWEQVFTAVMNRSMLPPGETEKACLVRMVLEKYALDPRRTAMVGDTAIDIVAGKAAGVVTVGATYGYGSVEELRSAGADRRLTLDDVRALA